MTMRFGVFVPQGWRMDLVGIDPAVHWTTMFGLAQRADSGPWESIWVYDHFPTTPTPIHEATHEAWTLTAALAARTTHGCGSVRCAPATSGGPTGAVSGGIPLWIAAAGEKVTCEDRGKVRAVHQLRRNPRRIPPEFRRKSAVLAEHCRSVGTDFGAITWSANHNVAIGATEKEVQERLSWIREHLTASIGADLAERQLSGFGNLPGVGTPEQIVEKLSALKAAGLSCAITYFPEAAYDTSGIELFEKEVIPALQ